MNYNFKFMKKNYNYITNYNNYYSLIIILFFLFLFFIKKNYKLIILYSLFVGIFYFFLNKYFVLVLFLIPITFIFNYNFKENADFANNEKYSRRRASRNLGHDQTDSQQMGDDSRDDVNNNVDKKEPTKCEKMFLIQIENPDLQQAKADMAVPDTGEKEHESQVDAAGEELAKITTDPDNIIKDPLN